MSSHLAGTHAAPARFTNLFDAVLAWTGPPDPAGPGILVAAPRLPAVPTLLESVDQVGTELGLKAHAILSLRLRSHDDRDTLRQIERRYGYDRRRADRTEEIALDAADGMTGCLAAVRDGLAALRGSLPGPPCSLMSQHWATGLGKAAARRVAQRYGGIFVVECGSGGEILVPFDPSLWNEALAAMARETDPASEEARRRIAASLGLDGPSEEACRKALLLAADRGSFPSRPRGRRADPDRILPRDSRAIARGARALIWSHKVSTPLTTRAILSKLLENLPGIAEGLDEEGLDRLLDREGLGPHRFRGGWLPPSIQRRPVPRHAAIEDLLVSAGAPMTLAEIGRRLGDASIRGKRGVAWIQGRLVELGGGRLGLVDRDLPIDANECRDVIETAHRLMAHGGFSTVGILRRTLSDRPYAPRLPGKDALASLLHRHGGIVVGEMGVLRGKVRAEPLSRGSVVNTMRMVLSEHPGGIAGEDLLREVGRRIGHTPKKDNFAAALRRLGIRDKVKAGAWRLRCPDASNTLPSSALSCVQAEKTRIHAYPAIRRNPPTRLRNPRWTSERVAILRKVLAAGGSSRDVMEALGGDVTRSAVIGKAHRIGIAVGS